MAPVRKVGSKGKCAQCGQRIQIPAPPNRTVLGEVLPPPNRTVLGDVMPLPQQGQRPPPQAAFVEHGSQSAPPATGRERSTDQEDDDERRPPFRRGRFQCPYCGSTEIPIVKKRISTTGWVVFAVLLVCTICLFWIGLLITEDYRECYSCGMKIGS